VVLAQQVAVDHQEALAHKDPLVALGHSEEQELQELQVHLVRLGPRVRMERQVRQVRLVSRGRPVQVERLELREALDRLECLE